MSSARLDQLLSRCGYCSRREVRTWIKQGRVLVRGEAAESADQRVIAQDVQVDGVPLDSPEGLLVLLHKPAGYVCSHDESEGQNVYDLLPERWCHRNPAINTIGRLDRDTTGVLLLTDLGPLIHRWTSPRHKMPKVYEVTTDLPIDPALVAVFASGTLILEGETEPCLPAKLEIMDDRQARLELTEGRYHQVKRMFAAVGKTVTRLHRSQFGDFGVEGLDVGHWRIVEIPA